jgi:hypothetical protein
MIQFASDASHPDVTLDAGWRRERVVSGIQTTGDQT